VLARQISLGTNQSERRGPPLARGGDAGYGIERAWNEARGAWGVSNLSCRAAGKRRVPPSWRRASTLPGAAQGLPPVVRRGRQGWPAPERSSRSHATPFQAPASQGLPCISRGGGTVDARRHPTFKAGRRRSGGDAGTKKICQMRHRRAHAAAPVAKAAGGRPVQAGRDCLRATRQGYHFRRFPPAARTHLSW